ncbi:MAG TPA: ABC transporter substrate-binding protein [Microbacterium sp.]|uniref:ABC transporter substrate-binding protein n=1 Tax=Microbacterium sp. TaxID=51671 RepID=UPI002CAE4D84|nr:ABC transporter substrate-binding protein [Microbacterium sp.]HWI31987.1 ABC transporter substrate-binding protein [Microbacterium sp.]
MKKTRAIVAATAALAVLALGGCTSGGGSAPPVDTTLTVGINTPPISLDPLRAALGNGRWYEDPAYTSVLDLNDDGEVIAGLADEWGYVGEGNTKFSFTLKPDLEFSDGTPLTAQSVVDSYNYFVANGSGPTRPYFFAITAEAVDDLTVELTSATPNPIMDQLVTGDYYAFAPISPAGLADDTARAGDTFGIGPYVLDKEATIPDNVYVYVKNENYFDEDAAKYEKIEVKVIPDYTQQVQALNTGQVELIQVDPNVASTLKDPATVLERASSWNGLLLTDRGGVNTPALADERVRQALAWAIDREAVAKASVGEYGTATTQVAIDGDPSWGYDPELEDAYTQDLDKAKDLLAEAGYPDGFSFTALYQGPSQADSKLVQALASDFAKIGVTMELKPEADFGAWVTDFTSGQYSASIFGGGGVMFLFAQGFWMPDGIMNPYKVSDQEMNDAMAALAVAEGDEVGPAAQEVNRVATLNALSIPVYQQTLIYAHADSVSDVTWVGSSSNLNSITHWTPAS